MRPANTAQAQQHMRQLLAGKITGRRRTRVKEHTQRAQHIAECLYRRFQVGPYQYRLHHLLWYLDSQTKPLSPATRYRHWLTIQIIVLALQREGDWKNHLYGPWVKPSALADRETRGSK
jgi:hypothetical protein